MSDFKPFADAINKRFLELAATGALFKVNVDKSQLWDTYQSAFPAGTNDIFRERRVHECNTCYSFIKKLGAVVSYIDGQIQTIWDVQGLESPYKEVAAAMHALVQPHSISSIFKTDEKLVGKEFNMEENEAGEIRWDHFYADIDQTFISQTVAATVGEVDQTVSVFKRALDEFSIETLETAIDLCDSIYKGPEFQPGISKFLIAKKEYEQSDKTVFCWLNYNKFPARIRNSEVGPLLIDIEAKEDIEVAVAKYEKIVSPANYKRTTTIATPRMREAAIKQIDELGMRDSLPRRHATLEDIPVNDVLFANADAQVHMQGSLEDILSTTSQSAVASKTTTEVSIEDFLSTVLPHSSEVEVLVENKHIPNFMSLVVPVNPEAPNMLKWANNVSWSYNGEMTDSDLRQKVAAKGGRVDGAFRFSHSWNEIEPNKSLMDLHVFMPGCEVPTRGGGPEVRGRRVGWNHRQDSQSGGSQDVDYTDAAPTGYIPVENITFPDINKMPEGVYTCKIHNWSFRSSGGRGSAEIEFDGQIFQYEYPATRNHEWITVATVTLKDGKFSIEHHLAPSSASREVYGTGTQQWQKVSTVMLSPNFWNGQTIGNKHFFFMIEGCKNPDPVRGFYNEFLKGDLRPHRKTFELLSSKMKCEPTDEQLSGLGFNSSTRNDLQVKVDGRPYLLKF